MVNINTQKEKNHYKFNQGITITNNGENTILFNFNQGNFYALDSLSAHLVESSVRGDIYQTIKNISSDYNISLQEVEKDAKSLIDDLLVKKIIVKDNKKLSIPSNFTIYFLLILARLCFLIFGLLPTIKLWRCFHYPLFRDDLPPEQTKELIEILSNRVQEECSKVLFLNVDCKERAIVSWTILQARGIKAELVLGAEYEPFSMHAWCESQGLVVGDNAQHCSFWQPVQKFS